MDVVCHTKLKRDKMSKTALHNIPDLHLAIRKGQFHDTRCLVTSGDDVNIKDPFDHRTPLMLCAMIDQESWGVGIARMLLERGAMVGYTDRRGQNALIYACIYERVELVRVFLKAVDYDPNHRDRWGNTALFYAASSGNEEIVNDMVASLNHFKLSVDRGNKWGMTPMLEACRLGHETIAHVLEQNGASIDARDTILGWGMTEWRQDHAQRIETAPRRRSYDKPWLRRSTGNTQLRSLTRSVSLISSSRGSDGLPSILNSAGNRSEVGSDDVFSPPTIVISQNDDFIQNKSHNTPHDQKGLSAALTKRQMLYKSWINDLTKGHAITAKFTPSPPSLCLLTQSAPNPSPSLYNRLNPKKMSWPNSHQPHDYQYQFNLKQIFHRYEIQASDSFRLRAKSPELQKPNDLRSSQTDGDHSMHRGSHANKFSRRQSTLDMNGSLKRLPSNNSMDLNSGRKLKSAAGEGASRSSGNMRGKREDSVSSVSTEDSAAKMMMNAFRRRKTNAQQSSAIDGSDKSIEDDAGNEKQTTPGRSKFGTDNGSKMKIST